MVRQGAVLKADDAAISAHRRVSFGGERQAAEPRIRASATRERPRQPCRAPGHWPAGRSGRGPRQRPPEAPLPQADQSLTTPLSSAARQPRPSIPPTTPLSTRNGPTSARQPPPSYVAASPCRGSTSACLLSSSVSAAPPDESPAYTRRRRAGRCRSRHPCAQRLARVGLGCQAGIVVLWHEGGGSGNGLVQPAGEQGNTLAGGLEQQPHSGQQLAAEHTRPECYPALNQAQETVNPFPQLLVPPGDKRFTPP
jgi:hypothetical protein